MNKKRLLAFIICAAIMASVGTSQVAGGLAVPDCTCSITVHGSNCPMSLCTCGGAHQEENAACPLSGMSAEQRACICSPDVHAPGCPLCVSQVSVEEEQPEDTVTEPGAEVKPEPVPDETTGAENNAGSEEVAEPAPEASPETAPKEEPAAGASGEKPVGAEAASADTVEDDAGGDAEYWEYQPAWAESGQQHLSGNLLAAVELRDLEVELTDYLDGLQTALAIEDESAIFRDEDNAAEILAAYAVLTEQTAEYPYGLKFDTDSNLLTLRSLYWSSTQVTGVSNTDGTALQVKRMTLEDIAEQFGFTAAQKQDAQTLFQNKPEAETLLSGSILSKLTDEEYARVTELIPEEISAERRAVLTAALSLEGKVKYFWGGKSDYVGWDDRWGELRTVVSEGSNDTGTVQEMGLDCSGFVTWAFLNADGEEEVLSYIGNGTANQYRNAKEIAWNEVMPGDLLFYKTPTEQGINHVGIVVSTNEDGTPKEVVHCSGSDNGVVVTDARGFKLARRPFIYAD